MAGCGTCYKLHPDGGRETVPIMSRGVISVIAIPSGLWAKQGCEMSTDWNEVEFLSWDEFKQMAPPIVQLEINRLSKLLPGCLQQAEVHNALVKARFTLRSFVAQLDKTARGPLDDACRSSLQSAILALATTKDALPPKSAKTVEYVIDRLTYILHRSTLLY